jgi:hypothetical protein
MSQNQAGPRHFHGQADELARLVRIQWRVRVEQDRQMSSRGSLDDLAYAGVPHIELRSVGMELESSGSPTSHPIDLGERGLAVGGMDRAHGEEPAPRALGQLQYAVLRSSGLAQVSRRGNGEGRYATHIEPPYPPEVVGRSVVRPATRSLDGPRSRDLPMGVRIDNRAPIGGPSFLSVATGATAIYPL